MLKLLWESTGVAICLVEEIFSEHYNFHLNIVSDAAGGAFVVWLDNRNAGGTDIYGTHILTDGSLATGWEENGSPIISEGGGQNQSTICKDGQGGAILVWHDERDPDNINLYMQRIASDGSLLWNENGTLVSNAQWSQEKAKIKLDGLGNFYIVWRDRRNENNGDIYAQYIDINGNLLWEEDVSVFTGTGIQMNPQATVTTDGNLVVAWEDCRNDDYYKDIYSQRIDSDGNLLWGTEGIAVCDATNFQGYPRISADNDSGVWIIWDDGRALGYSHKDVYLQHLNANGENLFEENGKLVCDASQEQFYPLIKTNSNGFLYTIWGDRRAGSTGIYFQNFDPTGEEILEEEKIIYYGLDGDARYFTILENDNNPVVIWEDSRFWTGTQIFMQVLSENGEFLLEKNGESITEMTGFDQTNPSATMYPGSNIVAAVWEEIRGNNKQIYAQAVDLEANSLWNFNGIAVGTFTSHQEYSNISVIDNNEAYDFYVGWSDTRGNLDFGIMAQKINETGDLQWNETGVVISDIDGDDTLADIVGRCFIWENMNWPNTAIYAKMVDENGEAADGWAEEGLVVCSVSGTSGQKTKGLQVPQGIFIAWQDNRNGQLDIYGQLISNTAEIQWQEDGVQLVSAEEDQYIGNFLYDEESLIMLWEDFRNTPNTDVYIQKFDMNGNFQWQENGNVVVDINFPQTTPYMVRNSNNYLIFWEDFAYGYQSELYAQAIDSNGEQFFGEDGFLICDAIRDQSRPMAVSDADNYNTYVIWEDTRSGGYVDIFNIYAQMVKTNEPSTDDNIVNSVNLSLKNYPNPFNPETTIEFSTTQNEQIELIIYNIKGQKLKTLINKEFEAGKHSIIWNGTDDNGSNVSSGIYLYKLKTENYSAIKKMLMIK
ncbi:MAG: T9SS type A sorting domain-containing protein [Candidatus Cloacimonetes bacterium]|nr:T9SS type A sorting domain-containing protein [Candidatus Cloacimonadota bacterium]